jgi:hypothetical protein
VDRFDHQPSPLGYLLLGTSFLTIVKAPLHLFLITLHDPDVLAPQAAG